MLATLAVEAELLDEEEEEEEGSTKEKQKKTITVPLVVEGKFHIGLTLQLECFLTDILS